MHLLLHLLSVLLFYSACVMPLAEAFSCGTDPVQNWIAEQNVRLNCPAKLGQFDACCAEHDACYAQQRGRANCDNQFCECLRRAATGGVLGCQSDSNLFCTLVRDAGQLAYDNAGRRG